MKKKPDPGKIFSELTAIMARLRGRDGCPWDREQTHTSLKRFLLEETYELLEAIDGNQAREMEEELGDLMLQFLFHCQIASEESRFDAESVLSRLKDKLIRRHPHVFSNHHLPDAQAVRQHWEKVKSNEKSGEGETHSLGNLPRAMPALARAQRVSERASHFGFDWPKIQNVWTKIEEEMEELKSVLSSGQKDRISEEMGDVFFSLVNLCRFVNIEAEESLTRCIDRFVQRFTYMEKQLLKNGQSLNESSLEEMDRLWEEAKVKLRAPRSGKSRKPRRRIKKNSTRS